MGIKDFLEQRKVKKRQKRIEKNIKNTLNKYAKTDERKHAMYGLFDDGSPDALRGLLKRFELRVDQSIEDEEEKELTYELILDSEESVLEPLKECVINSSTIAWPLKALTELSNEETVLDIVAKALDREGNEYSREPEKKVALINHLSDYQYDKIGDMILPFIDDVNDDVRIASINVLSQTNDERAREPMLKILTNTEEESIRLKNKIIEIFLESDWSVKGYKKKVEQILPSGYYIDDVGTIRLRPLQGKDE